MAEVGASTFNPESNDIACFSFIVDVDVGATSLV